MNALLITCADCEQARPRYARDRCARCYTAARRAGRLAVTPHQPWTPAERRYLERSYLRFGVATCAARLRRSRYSVLQQARRMGLDTRGGYRLSDLALALACGRSTITDWRRAGKVLATGRGYLNDEALHRFFCDHRALWAKYPCPDRDWIESLLADPTLRRLHGCIPQARKEGAHERNL